MFMKTFASLLIILFLSLPTVFGQKKKMAKAEEAYRAGEYYDAIDLYKDAYSMIKNKEAKTDVVFRIAECYRQINEPDKAEMWYKKAISRNYPDPVAILFYAQQLMKNGKYEQAVEEFNKYKQLVPNDPRSAEGIRSCDLALKWMEQPVGYKIEEMRFFNSHSSDYSPAYARDDYQVIYFTSSRDDATGNKIHGATGQNFADIFVSKRDRKGKWSTPVPLEGPVNTPYEEGTPSLTSDYNTMYFTRCEMDKHRKLGCRIMVTKKEDNKWGKPEALNLVADSLVEAHPAISPDGLTLYFVSDKPGGFGGKDIWRVTRGSEGEKWSEPENLGPDINTEENEMFPYVDHNGVLYFSSDGWPGMGGLDIFRAKQEDNGHWKIENMKYPINSPADDFGIIMENKEVKGYFSSSRKRRSMDDIYAFVLPPLRFSVVGTVRNLQTDEVIPFSRIKMIGSDGTILLDSTSNKGEFRFMLKPNTDYIFIASKEGYLNGKSKETTKGLKKSTELKTTIQLASIAKPIEIPNIYYDFGKWDLRPESMVALDHLVEVLNDNPNIVIELRSHTDSRASEEYNMELSQKRAQAVVDYLIRKGIDPKRLIAKGYGESMPKVVDKKLAKQYPFLKPGTVLNDKFINSLPNDEQKEICYQINRRTEFQVLRTDFPTKENPNKK